MAGVLSFAFFEYSLQLMTNNGGYTPVNLELHLFDNNYTPSSSSSIADVDDPTDATYVPVVIPAASWTISTVGGVSKAVCPLQNFTFTAGDNVYGWYLMNTGGASLMAAERFTGAPVVIPAFGGVLGVSVELDLQSP